MANLRHEQLYTVIAEFIQETGYAPSYDEIGARAGIAKSNVKYHLGVMREMGMINFVPGKGRTITLLKGN